MTAVAVGELAPRTLFDACGDEPTLDDLLARVWELLAADTPVECPLCGAAIEPEYGAQALSIGGRCAGCGSLLR